MYVNISLDPYNYGGRTAKLFLSLKTISAYIILFSAYIIIIFCIHIHVHFTLYILLCSPGVNNDNNQLGCLGGSTSLIGHQSVKLHVHGTLYMCKLHPILSKAAQC